MILNFFDVFTEYPIEILSNNSLYNMYKSSVCSGDEEFSRILLQMIQEFRLSHKNDSLLLNGNKTIKEFDTHIRNQYNLLLNKQDKTEDENYIFNNYLNFTMAADVFLYATLQLNKKYDFDFKVSFNLTEEEK